MHVTARIFLLRVIDELMQVALQRPIATRRVGVEPTARLHRHVGGLLHRLHREIAGRLEDDCSLATDPGDNGGLVFVIMPPTGSALLATTTGAASQRFLATALRLSLLASGVIEVIRFHGALQLPLHLVGQGGIAQPPTPAIARADM